MTVSIETLPSRASCLAARAGLDAYVRAGLPSREAHRVAAHLECCRACTGVYLELVSSPARTQAAVPSWPVRAVLGLALASVVAGGPVLAGLATLGGGGSGGSRGPDEGTVAAAPFATAQPVRPVKRAAPPSPGPPATATATPTPTPSSAPVSQPGPAADAPSHPPADGPIPAGPAVPAHSTAPPPPAPAQPGVATLVTDQLAGAVQLVGSIGDGTPHVPLRRRV